MAQQIHLAMGALANDPKLREKFAGEEIDFEKQREKLMACELMPEDCRPAKADLDTDDRSARRELKKHYRQIQRTHSRRTR